jgi:hypothetical protein
LAGGISAGTLRVGCEAWWVGPLPAAGPLPAPPALEEELGDPAPLPPQPASAAVAAAAATIVLELHRIGRQG